MNGRPVGVVLPVLENREVDRRKAASDRLEVRPVAAVAREVKRLAGKLQNEAAPKRGVALQGSAREVLRRHGRCEKRIAHARLFKPVELRDALRGPPPVLEMRTDAKRANNALDAIRYGANRRVVEVIVVIVRNEKAIDGRHVLGPIDVRTPEGLEGKRHGRGRAKRRIDKYAQAALVQEKT